MMNVLTGCQILFTVATTIVIVMLIILYVKCQIKTSIRPFNFLHLSL